jgi:hypothetical protein
VAAGHSAVRHPDGWMLFEDRGLACVGSFGGDLGILQLLKNVSQPISGQGQGQVECLGALHINRLHDKYLRVTVKEIYDDDCY